MDIIIFWIIFGFIFACCEHTFINKKDLKVNDLPDIITESMYGFLILLRIFSGFLKDKVKNNNTIIFLNPFKFDNYYGYDNNDEDIVSGEPDTGSSAKPKVYMYDQAREELKKREEERKKEIKDKEQKHEAAMIDEAVQCIEKDTYVTIFKNKKNPEDDNNCDGILLEPPRLDDIDIANKLLGGGDE